jgi:ribosomal protein S18 acetylase RimI-like enzyme
MVHPSWQRRGLATRMVAACEAMVGARASVLLFEPCNSCSISHLPVSQAWDAGMDKVVLTTLVANPAASALYRGLGYRRDKVRSHNMSNRC